MKLFILFTFFLMLNQVAEAADCGRFRVVKGEVQFKQQGQSAFEKARINKKICQGDTVKTGAESRAKVVMADKNELNISPSTELLIEVYQDNQKAVLNVINGKVRSNVRHKYDDSQKSHYRVKTKSAVAGVRGTEFFASYNNQTGQSEVVTFKGEVAVGKLQGGKFVPSVMVRAGQSSTVSANSTPTPARAVPQGELAKHNNETSISEPPRGVSSEPNDIQQDATPDSSSDDSGDNSAEPAPQEGANSGDGADGPSASTDDPSLGGGSDDSGPADKPADGPAPEGQADAGPAPSNNSAPKSGPADRGVASTPAPPANSPESFLPPPDLGSVDIGKGIGQIETPKIPTVMNPILPTIPNNQIVNDTIVNTSQKSNLTIVPKLPGQ